MGGRAAASRRAYVDAPRDRRALRRFLRAGLLAPGRGARAGDGRSGPGARRRGRGDRARVRATAPGPEHRRARRVGPRGRDELGARSLPQGAERSARPRALATLTPRPDRDGPGAPGVAVDVQRALAALPRRQREITVLHYFVDLPIAEIAREFGIAEGTVKSALHSARHVGDVAGRGGRGVTRHGI